MYFQKTPKTLISLPLVLIGLIAWQTYALKQYAPAEPAVVVSIDIERVFASLEERAYELSSVQTMVDEMDNDLKTRRQHIDSFEQEFELYERGSAKWDELMQEQQLAVLEYESQVEFARRKATRAESKGMRRIYEGIRESAKTLAKQHGWDYVFVNDSVVALPENNNIDMGAQISSRRLIFANTTFDVTDVLVEYMNSNFNEWAVR